MAGDQNFRKLWLSWTNRQNYSEVFTKLVEKFAGEQSGMKAAKSCLGFGTGAGEFELEFIKRCLPSVQTVTVVEQDAQSVLDFQQNMARQLPNVKGVVYQSSVQDWKGEDFGPAEVILMMRILYHIRETERQAFFQRLSEQWLSTGGYAIIIAHSQLDNPRHSAHLFSRMNPNYALEPYDDIKRDMLAASFIVEREVEFKYWRDFSHPDEAFLQLHQHLVGNTVSVQQVRDAMQEMFPDGKTDQNIHTFAVFRKA